MATDINNNNATNIPTTSNNNNNNNDNNNNIFVHKDSPSCFANLPPYIRLYGEINDEGEERIEQWIKDMRSYHLAVIRNANGRRYAVRYNQRIRGVVMINCKNCQLQVLDSAVFTTQTCTVINCDNCELIFEDVDVRHIQLYGVTNSKVMLISSPPLTEMARLYWRENSKGNKMQIGRLLSYRLRFGIPFESLVTADIPDTPEGTTVQSYVDKCDEIQWKIVNDPGESSSHILSRLAEAEATPFPFTREQLDEAYNQEKQEYYDSPEELREKARKVIEILRGAKRPICYTGAGVSTSASIPDFRGPTGLWTNMERGTSTRSVDMTKVRPTYSHYALTHLVKMHLIHFMITSNVDSLHLRTGIPPNLLVECHGNIYKEVCERCGKVYMRQYDVDSIDHFTGMHCTWCKGRLRDTHVGFGENVGEMDLAVSLFYARQSDVSFILGTSMNVQPSVAFQLQPKFNKTDGKIILVNLQKTPYDHNIDIRVFAKTDDFLKILMEELGQPDFDRTTDLHDSWDSQKVAEKQQKLTGIKRR